MLGKVAALIAITLLATQVAEAESVHNATSCDDEAPGWIEDVARNKGIPGIAVAIAKHGRIIWSFGHGMANVEQGTPVLPDRSRFRIGSTSKALTAFGLMRLVEARTIDLEAPIQTYVPAFPDARSGVTLRRLGGHLAGIRHYDSMTEPVSQVQYPTVTGSLKIFLNDPLVAEPGEKYVYSTYGYTLISAAIESVTDETFLDYMARQVFEPAGMLHTVPDQAAEIVPDRTGAYYIDGGELRNGPAINSSYKWAGGGFLSSAVDVVRFGMAHFDRKLLSAESREILWTSQRDGEGSATGYGIGWFVENEWVQHPGGTLGGSALLRIYPEDRVVIAILGNLSLLEDRRFDDLPEKLYTCFSRGPHVAD